MGNDEKDRLGRALHDKERAEEDRYFAERDRELLRKLKEKRQAEEESAAQRQAALRCPKCGARLQEAQISGVTADECPACHGMWLDRGELEQAVKYEAKTGWLTRYLERIRER